MRTYTVTEKYRAVNEGKMAKSEFVRQMRLGYPEHITQWNGFKDTVQILKNRGLLFEEVKPIVVEEKIDAMKLPYSLEALDRGIRHEFAEAKIEYHAGANINMDQYNDALKKAKANLDKDPMHYLNILAGNDKNVDKNDQMKPVSDKPDVFNGLKKADLREAKTMLKEGKMDDLAEKLGIDVGRLQAAADRLREMEREDAAETAGKVNAMKAIIDEEPDEVMNIDRHGNEKEDKESNYTKVKEAEEMDQEEYHLKRKEAANAAIDILRRKFPEVTAGILKDFLRTHMDDLYGGADPIEEFENYVSVNYDSLEEESVSEKKGKDHDGDGDVDGDDYMAAKDKAIKKAMGKEPQQEISTADIKAARAGLDKFAAREKELDRQNPNRHKEAGAKAAAARDAARAAKKKSGNNTAKYTSFYNKEEKIKEAIKKIVKESLAKDTLNEAATNHLAAMADTYGDYKGMTVVLNDLQNIVTDIESYYAKQKDRLEGVFKKVGEIQNEEGFKVGGFLAPAIESAFVKDSRHLGGSRFMKGVQIPQVKVAKFDNLRQEEAPVEAAPKETIFGINEKGEFKLRKDL